MGGSSSFLAPRILKRDLSLMLGLIAAGGVLAYSSGGSDRLEWVAVAFVWLVCFLGATRWLAQCPQCHMSAFWWLASKRGAGPFPLGVLWMKACPKCGYCSQK